ncbi:hypothetical protein D3C73_726410 [compost metagenome]
MPCVIWTTERNFPDLKCVAGMIVQFKAVITISLLIRRQHIVVALVPITEIFAVSGVDRNPIHIVGRSFQIPYFRVAVRSTVSSAKRITVDDDLLSEIKLKPSAALRSQPT